MADLSEFLGPVSSRWLREIGITDTAALQSIGIEETFRLLVLRGFPVNASLLYGLDAAYNHCKLTDLSETRKSELRTIAKRIKGTM